MNSILSICTFCLAIVAAFVAAVLILLMREKDSPANQFERCIGEL